MKIKTICFIAVALFLISADGCEDTSTSIEKLYPNPVENVLHVELDIESLTDPFQIDFQITNMQGQTVKSGIFDNINNTVDCSQLQPGQYIITVISSGESSKFIKK